MFLLLLFQKPLDRKKKKKKAVRNKAFSLQKPCVDLAPHFVVWGSVSAVFFVVCVCVCVCVYSYFRGRFLFAQYQPISPGPTPERSGGVQGGVGLRDRAHPASA